MACEPIGSFSAATMSNVTYYDSNGSPVTVGANTPLNKNNEVHRMLIRHLYRRIGYGASLADIEYIHDNNKTLGSIVNELIADAMATSLPQEFDWSVRSTLPPNYELIQESGTTYPRIPFSMYTFMIANYWINECITESVKSKLLMFWHSHFSIKIDDYKESYAVLQYFKILFNNAFGDFKEMVKKIGRTPMMLFFLSGFDSSGEPTGTYTENSPEPNENYARELLELFTMGIKSKNGVDNNYTEDDIAAIARALTGWRIHDDTTSGIIGWNQSEEELAEILDESKFHFEYKQHDWGTKTLFKDTPNEVSFNSLEDYWKPVIPGNANEPQNLPDARAIAAPNESGTPEEKYVFAGTDEYNGVHDIIFDKKKHEIAYFICKKLYEFYVYADTENSNIGVIDSEGFDLDSYISSLADTFVNQNWSIEEVLKQLFKSQHFYDVGIMGTQIKSHVESSVSLLRSTALQPVDDYEYRLTLLTPNEAGQSPKDENDGSGRLNPNYNGEDPYPPIEDEEYPVTQPFYYANNNGQINIMTGEGATLEDVTDAQFYFFNTQMTWAIKKHSGSIGQDLFMPPSVEGWPGHREWINEYTLVKRQEILLCALRDFSDSTSTKEKFRQLAESLLVLEYGEQSIYEPDLDYGGDYEETSQYQSPEKLVRVLWKHFFAVKPEDKDIEGTRIGQIVDAVSVYVGTWQSQHYRPRLDIRGCNGFPDSSNPPYCAVNQEDKEEMANRVIDVLEYFVRQPEFHLT